jgi:fatty-acyl-CoA synthase
MIPSHSFEPLTPTSFLTRAAHVHRDRIAVVDGERRYSYAEFHGRAQRQAGMLAALGVAPGDRVAVLAPNTHVLLEAHYGVPLAGAVLVALNYRLTATELAYIIDHSGASVLIHDPRLADCAADIRRLLDDRLTLVDAGEQYEELLRAAPPLAMPCADECGLLALNYTSGTTGKPKGVMYHHRGATLQSMAMAMQAGLRNDSVYLWTLPMFHCNGWCFTWAVTAAGGTHLCLDKPQPESIWHHLRRSGVTHLSAAPTVLTMMAWDDAANGEALARTVQVGTGGAPPTPALLERMAHLGIDVTHLYGLTETYGPSVICEWHGEWNALPAGEQARLKARQGVGNVISQQVRVVDEAGGDVAADGRTHGEIALRGNNVTIGYYRDPDSTRNACPDGWFRTGDVGVMHPDGYVELRDRSKDIIISGGENIASVEVEQALAAHPAVLEAAVVAAPDAKWGEVPIAFVMLKAGASADEPALLAHLRQTLAGYKVPKRVVFGELPKTATGKAQKFLLRERARALRN